ncbi:MAG: SCP2 domain-containing protein [Steroidobacteraceae bacterium]
MQATAAARRLNGTSLQIEIEGVHAIRAAVSGERLALMSGGEGEANAVITGSPWSLIGLFAGGLGSTAGPAAEGRAAARIRGDAEVASRYRELFVLARPDFEEELSRLAGDVPARALSQFGRAAFSWVRKSARTAGENLAEYLQEESRDLVNRAELEEFLLGVDQSRETADRIEIRLAHLERRFKGTA